jgi:LPS sulfotransferase NodH
MKTLPLRSPGASETLLPPDRSVWQAAASWLAGLRLSPRIQEDYLRFILLGRSRTGSNFLRGLIASHPQAIVLGEILKNPAAIEWGTDAPAAPDEALEVYRRDPERFLETYVFCGRPRHLRALGFKLFYYHARSDPWSRAWPYLQTMPGLRVIHIKRRNILRTHLSRVRAEQTDRWVKTSGEPEALPPVELEYAACRRDFEQTRAWEQEADAYFAGREMLEVVYEDLVAQPAAQAGRVQDFLGLTGRPLAPQTHQQSRQPLSAAIANYESLKRQFAGSPWQAFFDE